LEKASFRRSMAAHFWEFVLRRKMIENRICHVRKFSKNTVYLFI